MEKRVEKRPFFIIWNFFVFFFFPFVSSVNLFVCLLCIISPLSSPCTPLLLCSPPLSSPLLLSSPLASSPLLLYLSFRLLFRQTFLWSTDPTPHTPLSNPLGVLLTDTQFSCFIAYDKTLPLISHYRPTLWKWAPNPFGLILPVMGQKAKCTICVPVHK